MHRQVPMAEVKEVLRLWRAGLPRKRVAAQLGLDPKTVRRYLTAATAAGVRGEGHGVTDDEVRDTLLALQPVGGRPRGDGWAQCEAQRPSGDEGKWFAAVKDAKLFDEAITLANATPCDPRTLTRAARDFGESNPKFALEAGLAALRWLVAGHGYEITALDVRAAYTQTLAAAARAGVRESVEARIRSLFDSPTTRTGFVAIVIGKDLG